MHTTRVVLKDGRPLSGSIWEWRPSEGWFSLVTERGNESVNLRDVSSAVTSGARVSIRSGPEGEDRDELARARKDGWDGT